MRKHYKCIIYSILSICKEFVILFINPSSFHVCEGGQGRFNSGWMDGG